jgi:methanogenic corrinoid protein MtbC1
MSSPDGADIPQVAVDMLTGLLRAGDADSAQQFVATLLSGGTSRVEVIDGLLGPALARIGQLWQDGGVSVAVEHRATNIVDARPPGGGGMELPGLGGRGADAVTAGR